MKKPSKSTVLSTLIIGIIGTAIWEKFLSPLCTFIYVKLSSLIDSFSNTFSNRTYTKISEGYNNSSTVDIALSIMLILFILLCIFFLFYNLYQSKRKLIDYTVNDSSIINLDKLLKTNKLLNFLFFILIELSLLVFMYWFGNISFIDRCKTSSLCNLEIISPYVSDIEYKELKSSFYSIQTKEDYEAFTKTIKAIGEKYSLNLKE